jgi:hypothetical protein
VQRPRPVAFSDDTTTTTTTTTATTPNTNREHVPVMLFLLASLSTRSLLARPPPLRCPPDRPFRPSIHPSTTIYPSRWPRAEGWSGSRDAFLFSVTHDAVLGNHRRLAVPGAMYRGDNSLLFGLTDLSINEDLSKCSSEIEASFGLGFRCGRAGACGCSRWLQRLRRWCCRCRGCLWLRRRSRRHHRHNRRRCRRRHGRCRWFLVVVGSSSSLVRRRHCRHLPSSSPPPQPTVLLADRACVRVCWWTMVVMLLPHSARKHSVSTRKFLAGQHRFAISRLEVWALVPAAKLHR